MPTESIHVFVEKNNPEKDLLAVLQYISDRNLVKNFFCQGRNGKKTYAGVPVVDGYFPTLRLSIGL